MVERRCGRSPCGEASRLRDLRLLARSGGSLLNETSGLAAGDGGLLIMTDLRCLLAAAAAAAAASSDCEYMCCSIQLPRLLSMRRIDGRLAMGVDSCLLSSGDGVRDGVRSDALREASDTLRVGASMPPPDCSPRHRDGAPIMRVASLTVTYKSERRGATW